jgi:hypothetical protein
MSVYRSKKSPFYQYDFQLNGHRFFGSTECTTRKDAEKFESVERAKAKALVKAMKRSAVSLLIDDVADRLWNESAQHDAAPDATETNLARLIEYFGKAKALTDIDHNEAKKMVAWRRGHCVTRYRKVNGKRVLDQNTPLISASTVNRSATKVLQRLFTFAKAEGAQFESEPKWTELLLPEPLELVFSSRCRAGIRSSCSAMSRSTATNAWAACAASAIPCPTTAPSRSGSGCAPAQASRISASTTTAMISGLSCCATAATSNSCRRR